METIDQAIKRHLLTALMARNLFLPRIYLRIHESLRSRGSLFCYISECEHSTTPIEETCFYKPLITLQHPECLWSYEQ